METVVEKFLRYVQIYTTSNETEEIEQPTSKCQWDLLHLLNEELQSKDIQTTLTNKGYLYGKIKSNSTKQLPKICFISHIDTSPDVSGENVKPKIWKNYDGKDLQLGNNCTLSPNEYPDLKEYIGQTIITTDGTTLLGADDKAGVAEIMTMLDNVLHNDFEHGDICFAFTPDEEVGRGTDNFDMQTLGADFGYTVDGGKLGEIEYENFNAGALKVEVFGKTIHPGYAKDKMKNAIEILQEFNSLLPKQAKPQFTDGYDGFFHLHTMHGTVEYACGDFLIREFDEQKYQQMKQLCFEIQNKLNEKYGNDTVVAHVKDSYANMATIIKSHTHLIDNAKLAMQQANVKPSIVPIRGGTDGARLSFMGLPCPNLCAGGHNFHSKHEFIVQESMEKIVEILLNIVKIYAN